MLPAGRVKARAIFSVMLMLTGAVHGAPPPMRHLPPPVRQTIREQLGEDGKMGRVTKSTEDEQTVFEVTITKDGRDRDLTIAASGTILEREVFLDEVSASVKSAILQTARGEEVDDITQTTDDGQINYDVETIKGGVTRDFTIGPAGQLLSLQVTLAETPPAAQKTVGEKTQGATNIKIHKTTEEGEETYEVE